jgi:cytochrome o ubiquinol oxidase operon protein cyoD
MNTSFDSKNYFEEIGAWPAHSRSIGYVYAGGFALSLLFTLGAYFVAVNHLLPQVLLLPAIIVFAALQFFVQMTCFLHLGREASSRNRLIVFACVTGIVIILVAGSLWIMNSLNQRMMPSAQQMQEYMQGQAGI